MANTRFNEALVKLADQIAEDDELDCLRFIATSVLKSNQFDKDAKEIFDLLQYQQFLLPNKLEVLYDALTFMGRLDLRGTFLEEIGKSNYVHKGQSINSFSRMLIDVRETLSLKSSEWETLLFLYKRENGGAGVVKKNNAFAALQYLLDKDLLANDKQTLNKFARFLKVALVVQGERHVKSYLINHPEIPERVSAPCTGGYDRTDETEQSDSLANPQTTIYGNENMVLVRPLHVTINQVAQPQSTNLSQGASVQQPIAKGLERFESLAANQHTGFNQKQPISAMSQSVDQLTQKDHVGQSQRMIQGPANSQGNRWPVGDQRTESDQQLLRARPTNRTESPEPEEAIRPLRVPMDSPDTGYASIDHQPSRMNDKGVLPSGGSRPTGRSTPDEIAPCNPFSPVVNPLATGKWCTDRKCHRFTKDEIEKMKKEEIGRGGFGIVYRGIWIPKVGEEQLDVAIKVFDKGIAEESGQGNEQLVNELQAVELSKHCFSSTVLGYCQDQNYKALVYPYMKNKDLKTMLDDNSPGLTWQIRLRILYQICAVMCHFHNRHKARDGGRCVHGDVKDDNIFLDDNFNAFLGDFGILTFLRETGTSITKVDQPSALGYRDPDAGMRLSQSSDIYQFGVLSFRCLTSKPAHENGKAWCSHLAATKEKYMQDSKDDLLKIVDRTVWKSEPIIEKLTDVVIRCIVRNTDDLKRLPFTNIFCILDELLKQENILSYDGSQNILCICCQINRPIECDPKCGCQFRCSECLRNKNLSCPLHISENSGTPV